MQTNEIQQNEWPEFFDNFSRKNHGTPVGFEILGQEIGAQTEENGLALEGITAEWDQRSGNTIMIMFGANPDDHITHSITRPIQVHVEQNDDGGDVALAIKSEDGSTALLRFQTAVQSRVLDAVAC